MIETPIKPRRRWLVVGCWGVGVLLGGYLCLACLFTFIEWAYFPFGHSSIVESHGRLDRAGAKNQFDFDYPESAHDIQFACYSQWIAVEEFVRFEAPLEDCVRFVEKSVAEHNQAHPDRPVAELSPITEVSGSANISSSAHFSTEWFDLAAIRNGFAAGSIGSHTPQLWIDADRCVVYFKYTD